MSGAGLHAGYALATAMWSQVAGVRMLLARTLLVFQAAVLAAANGRFGGVLGVLAVRLVLLRHGTSFREPGCNGPHHRYVPGDLLSTLQRAPPVIGFQGATLKQRMGQKIPGAAALKCLCCTAVEHGMDHHGI